MLATHEGETPMEGTRADIGPAMSEHEADLIRDWLAALAASDRSGLGRVGEAELTGQMRNFLRMLRDAVDRSLDARDPAYHPLREFLGDVSRSRARQGFTASETAVFVFSAKEPLVRLLNERGMDSDAWALSALLDDLGLYTTEVYQLAREEVIARQQQEISELSTPVVKLWDGILALPLIGTLDSERTQVVMENLLQMIVDHGAEVAIIDITGVPTVDTLVAQHLLKTVAAARLMGAECLVSGIRPQIAQTMVHLGVELNVVSKATLADAFALALRHQGLAVVKVRDVGAASGAPRI